MSRTKVETRLSSAIKKVRQGKTYSKNYPIFFKFSEVVNNDHTRLVCEFQLSPLLGLLVVSEQSHRSQPRGPAPAHRGARLVETAIKTKGKGTHIEIFDRFA